MRDGDSSRRRELVAAIAEEEAHLARIEAEQAAARSRLQGLRAQLASLGIEPTIRVRLRLAASTPAPNTRADKVRLFRSLFRGREDVFPTRFVSRKTGKPGYTPECRNKFVRGVCELPKVNAASVRIRPSSRSTTLRS